MNSDFDSLSGIVAPWFDVSPSSTPIPPMDVESNVFTLAAHATTFGQTSMPAAGKIFVDTRIPHILNKPNSIR